MKKFLSVFIFLFANKLVFAQTKSSADSAWVSGQVIIAPSVGQFHPDFKNLNSQLQTQGATKSFLPIQSLGITVAGTLCVGRNATFDAGVSWEEFLQQEISIGDSLHYRLYGWHVMTSIYGKDVIPGPKFALVLAPGIDWGSLWLDGNLNNVDRTHFWNKFISPFARAELRFVFWRIAIGIRGSYRYDISKSAWKADSNHLPLPASSKITGFGLQFFIGYGRAE